MSEQEWFVAVQKIISEAGYEVSLQNLTEYTSRVEVISYDPDVDNMTFLVHRNKRGGLSCDQWRPVEQGGELRAKVESVLDAMTAKRTLQQVNSVTKSQLDAVAASLKQFGLRMEWKQPADWKIQISVFREDSCICVGHLHYGNSGLRTSQWTSESPESDADVRIRQALAAAAPDRRGDD